MGSHFVHCVWRQRSRLHRLILNIVHKFCELRFPLKKLVLGLFFFCQFMQIFQLLPPQPKSLSTLYLCLLYPFYLFTSFFLPEFCHLSVIKREGNWEICWRCSVPVYMFLRPHFFSVGFSALYIIDSFPSVV
jgi:hypothetical protein